VDLRGASIEDGIWDKGLDGVVGHVCMDEFHGQFGRGGVCDRRGKGSVESGSVFGDDGMFELTCWLNKTVVEKVRMVRVGGVMKLSQ